jgi:hypothetical protein
MTSDYRITSDFILDILDTLDRHGYVRGDYLHVGRAAQLIGDVARIYEGSLDAPRGAYVAVPSAEPQPPGPSAVSVSPDQVKTLLAALDDAAEYKRDRAETCADCADQSCTTCQWRLQSAGTYDHLADHIVHAVEASTVTQERAPGRAAADTGAPHPAADREAGQ